MKLEIRKLDRVTEPSQETLDKNDAAREKLEALRKDDEITKKVRKEGLFTHNYLKLKNASRISPISTNAESANAKADSSVAGEVVPHV